MIRSLRPSDLVALVLFNSKALTNQAQSKDRLSKGDEAFHPLRFFLEQWFHLEKRRRTVIHFYNGRIRSLVSARRRSGPRVWEIDCLLLEEGGGDICFHLLEKLSAVGGSIGIEKVFLRLPANSPLIEATKQAGFSHYLAEFLYHSEGRGTEGTPAPNIIRSKLPEDQYALFQLYSAAVPIAVRSIEGMTFQEWQETKDQSSGKEFVYEKDGRVSGWLRIIVHKGTGYFEIMAHPLEEDKLGLLMNCSLAPLADKSPLLCMALEFQGQLRQLLVKEGFEEIAEYSTFVKQLTAWAKQPSLIPMPA